MPLAQSAELHIDGAPSTLRVVRVQGEERIHAPYRFEVVCAAHEDGAPPPEIVAEDVLGKPAKLSWSLPDGEERAFEGLVDAVSTSAAASTITIVPKLALLSDCVDHVVFLDEDAVSIATKVLKEHAITVDARVLRTLRKRPQCVQLFESDLAFVTRILAEEGVALYLPLTGKDEVVLSDHAGGFEAVPGIDQLQVVEHGGLETSESVSRTALRHVMATDKLSLRDYFFENPTLDLQVDAADGRGDRERYEYPGGYDDSAVGRDLAKIRLEEARGRRVVLTGITSSRRLAPGHVIALDGAALDAVNGQWLILDVKHRLVDHAAASEGDSHYEAHFTAVPAAGGHRPARQRAPRALGLQTTTVTAAGGSEIHTDSFGRSRVHLRWDRRRPLDDTSSTWTRVLQPATTGAFFQPRTGWEEVTAFSGPSADVPWLLGRLDNGAATPPKSLPGSKTSTMFGSGTTPGGGSANVVLMDDTAGNEGLGFVASKDFNERTENDKATDIKADDTHTVGSNRKLIVGNVHQVAVTGAQTYTVGSSRTVNLESNFYLEAASESVMVGGLRLFNVGGDYSTSCASLVRLVGGAKIETAIESQMRAVTGASAVMIGGSWNERGVVHAAVQVAGANAETVAGAKTIDAGKYELTVRGALSETLASRKVKASGKVNEEYTGPLSLTVASSTKLKGADVTIKATSKLTLKASGITVEITPGNIKIDGKFDGKVKSVDDGDEKYDG
ncbi:Rhs element Vgr family protein [Minicystis rosea]|nr:Rhs element Vgr family protein [Minicystis rosea]